MNHINPNPPRQLNETTRMATTETVLSPRFYTTDFSAMDALDVSSIREDWDELMAEFRRDPNKGHFVRTAVFDEFRMDDLPEPLQKELLEFLVSSVTAEFSGCVLYAEIKKRIKNPDIKELFAVFDCACDIFFVSVPPKILFIPLGMGWGGPEANCVKVGKSQPSRGHSRAQIHR